MKVLLVDINCKYSSTGNLVYQIYRNVNEHNSDNCAICFGRGNEVQEKNIYKFGFDWETNLHALMTRITGYTGCYSYFSTRRLIKYIERYQPDIIHIHELHAYFVNIKQFLKYLARKKIPLVFTLHCEFNYTGKCGHSLECDKWKTSCGKCPHIKDYPKSILFDHTKKMHNDKKKLFSKLRDISIITTVSPWLTERASQSLFKGWNIKTIYNGVDSNTFFHKEYQELKNKLGIQEKIIILAVAPHIMNPEKGGNYIEALAERMPQYHFVLIGTDENEIRQSNNMTYVPLIKDKQELATYYSMGDVFVICSVKETFSLTCVEAMCCGTPVVGFKCGAPEMIFKKPYALFVDYGDIDALERVIDIQIYNTKDDIADYGRRFSIKFMLNEYDKVYSSLR